MKTYNPKNHITTREVFDKFTQYLIDRWEYQIRTIRDSYGNSKIVKRTWANRTDEYWFNSDETLLSSEEVWVGDRFVCVYDRHKFNQIKNQFNIKSLTK